MTFYYCYDAHCGWCYGFSKAITEFFNQVKDHFRFEVLSGGMIPPEAARPIKSIAPYIANEYKRVEELSGAKFGTDYLWHIQNAEESDWVPESLTPAVVLCIFKEYVPNQQVAVAADIQKAMFEEGRDLSDGEAYRHLLKKYNIPTEEFYTKLKSEQYAEQAKYEFALCRQLQVTGFPKLLLQVSDTKFYLVAEGFTPATTLYARVENIMKELDPTIPKVQKES